MKPIQITMQAFGSYIQRTTVDFTKLGENPIFLITGATGGGKTTILDAMCFALYCKATGGRRSWGSMVSTATPERTETMVDFVFALGGETYRFTRSQQKYAARGTGVVKTKEEHTCYRMDGADWKLILTGAESKIREQAEKLLGLNCEQFSQVMVLPQGDFLKLLLANSRDKAQMFQTLFATGRWAQVTLVLKKMADALQQQANDLTTAKKLILEREEISTAEQLEQKCQDVENQLKTADVQLALLGKELEQRNSDLNAALALSRKFENKDTLRMELENLSKKQSDMAKKRDSLKLSRLARNVYPYYTAHQAAQRDYTAKAQERKAAQERKNQAQGEQKSADEKAPDAKVCREAATTLAQTTSKLEAAYSGAQRLKKIKLDIKAKEEQLALQNGGQERLIASLKDAQERYQKGLEYVRKAQEKNQRLPQLMGEVQALLKRDAAAALATGLQEGKPCPVCGAIHHPVPAKQSEELKLAQTELDEAKQSGEALIKYEKRLKELEQIQQREQQKFEEGKTVIAALEREQASLQAAAAEVLASLGSYSDADSIEKELQSVQSRIKQNAERANQIEARISAAHTVLAAAGAAAEGAEKAFAESEQAAVKAKSKFEVEAAAANLKPDTDFSAIVYSLERESALEKELDDYSSSRKSKQEQFAELEQELQDREKPNLVLVKFLQSEAQQKNSEMAQRTGSLMQSADSARKSFKKLTELTKQGSDLEEQYSRTSRLATMLSGKTGLKIPLQQFVLGIMLDDILSSANATFSILSNGRYSLSRVTGASGGNALGGLDLQVFDAYSGGVRSVETLSGGELFLASLSLAFGLSDVVQNYSGSVHLDSIFIDEGFGSLDQDTLDTAMKALLQIQQRGRTIGIISHVTELKTRIAAQIIVTKGADGGSSAAVYCS
jgi:DNA repair protein SbcC/Rad50